MTCSANHYANVDPFSGSTNSHTHEFFSNAQAWPGVSSAQLGAYVANINTVTITHATTGTQATVQLDFDLPTGVGSNPFNANDKLYVSGVDNNGPLDQDVNSNSNVPYGVWIVTGVPSTSSIKFKIATNPASRVDVLTKDTATVGLSISQTGTVPDDLVTAQADLPRRAVPSSFGSCPIPRTEWRFYFSLT